MAMGKRSASTDRTSKQRISAPTLPASGEVLGEGMCAGDALKGKASGLDLCQMERLRRLEAENRILKGLLSAWLKTCQI